MTHLKPLHRIMALHMERLDGSRGASIVPFHRSHRMGAMDWALSLISSVFFLGLIAALGGIAGHILGVW